MAGSRGDIEAGRAFVTLFLKNNLSRQLTGVIDQARAGLKQFANIAMTTGRALSKIGTAISASYIAIAAGNEEVRQKTAEVHKLLANAVAPAVLPIIEHARQAAMKFAAWAQNNKETLTLVLQIGLRMAAVGTALKLAAAAAKGLAATLVIVRGLVVTISILLNTTWLGPLLLVLGALVAIGAIAYRLNSNFRFFFDQNSADWAVWAKNVLGIIKSISNAIIDGRFVLAWRIVLAGMEIEAAHFATEVIKIFTGALIPILEVLAKVAPAIKPAVDLLKGLEAAARGIDDLGLPAMRAELDKLMKEADKRLKFEPFGGAASGVKSAITAGGAAALTFGTGQDIATKSFNELQAIKKAAWENARIMREMAARRAHPGIFGK